MQVTVHESETHGMITVKIDNLSMAIFKALIASTFTWETLPNFFHGTRWNGNSNFSSQLLVDPVCVLPISNISVCTGREKGM